jgi:hypothetical protein
MVAIARGELFCFGIKHSRVKYPIFPQLKHRKLWLGACYGGLTATYCGGGVGARLNYVVATAVAAAVARIAAVRIVGYCPNSPAVVVNVADPQVGYTPCGTWEEHH